MIEVKFNLEKMNRRINKEKKAFKSFRSKAAKESPSPALETPKDSGRKQTLKPKQQLKIQSMSPAQRGVTMGPAALTP